MALAQVLNELSDLANLNWVQANGGLVQDQQLWFCQQGIRQPNPLPVPFGKLADHPVTHLVQAALPENFVEAVAAFAARHAFDLRAKL